MPMNNVIKLINTSKLQMLRLTIKCRGTPMTMRIGDNVEYVASHSNFAILGHSTEKENVIKL